MVGIHLLNKYIEKSDLFVQLNTIMFTLQPCELFLLLSTDRSQSITMLAKSSPVFERQLKIWAHVLGF